MADSKLDLTKNEPQDVITAQDVPNLLEDVFALEKRQEAAVVKAADVLAKEFGGHATCEQYKIQKDGSLLVVYSIKPAPHEHLKSFIEARDAGVTAICTCGETFTPSA